MPESSETLVSAFCDTAGAQPDRVALILPAGDSPPRTLTWSDISRDARRLAVALRKAGVRPGDRVAQVSENRYEWVLVDLAVHLLRAVHVAVHAMLSGAQIAWQIRDCEARLIFVSTAEQAAKLAADNVELSSDLQIVSFDRIADSALPMTALADFLAVAANDHEQQSIGDALEAAALAETRPDDLATILYTSGTTGEPKGVMLSHRNLVSNARGMFAAYPHKADELRLCFLPLSHIYARTCDLYTWIIGRTQLALAENRERILANCQSLRPTLLNGVPYFFDKVRRFVESQTEEQTQTGDASPGRLSDLFGGRLRLCSSGGAALPSATAEFYRRRGVRLVQGYGLTESSPVISVSHPDSDHCGSVGRLITGIEVRIAADGEILTRGPHVMLGYWRHPEATAEVIRDGWLHTGDLGQLDADGYLWITGRKKELIVTAAGKNIAPVAIESLLAEELLILQAVVIGEGRNFLSALIVPNPDRLREEIIRRQIPVFSPAQALAHPDVRALYRERIDARLAGLSESEKIHRFAILDRALSAERDELTPTLKLRRATIQEHFADVIDRMYTE